MALWYASRDTRVALYKHFGKSGVKGAWSHIPALVHDEIDDASVHAIRLQIHLVGTRPWDPYSTAKYLCELRTQEHLPFATIVDFCGGRQTEVVESINAYADMEQFIGKSFAMMDTSTPPDFAAL